MRPDTQTDRHTDGQTYTLITILRTPTGGKVISLHRTRQTTIDKN